MDMGKLLKKTWFAAVAQPDLELITQDGSSGQKRRRQQAQANADPLLIGGAAHHIAVGGVDLDPLGLDP
jgi:hypothetical protein